MTHDINENISENFYIQREHVAFGRGFHRTAKTDGFEAVHSLRKYESFIFTISRYLKAEFSPEKDGVTQYASRYTTRIQRIAITSRSRDYRRNRTSK